MSDAKAEANLAYVTAYQVTGQLLVAEQQGIWTRLGHFLSLDAAAAGVISFAWNELANHPSPTPRAAPLLAVFAFAGMVFSLLVGLSFYRSWKFRDFFAARMRDQEKHLRLDQTLGPLTSGNTARADFGRLALSQPIFSYVVCGLFFAIYLVLFGLNLRLL